jgi:NAD(P)-dependent dehydrogenase (short-subunit alcohol dehydrogenase family)
MANHRALTPGRAAAITGGASGIGLAAAKRFAAMGMKVAIADVDVKTLAAAAKAIAAEAPAAAVIAVPCDVSRIEDMRRFQAEVYRAFGEVAIFMNNAGTGPGGGPFDHYDRWQHVIGVNLWGIINGVHVFAPPMIAQGTPAAIVCTGSKQGITCPPGDTAYNVSKAGVKAVTEGLQHALRNTDGCQVSAHLLVPGWTFTGLTARSGGDKPAGAWWPEQVIDFLLEALGRGDFYILCPDNDVTRAVDERRILWAAGDLVENRPPLSRWHPQYQDAFAEFLARRQSNGACEADRS